MNTSDKHPVRRIAALLILAVAAGTAAAQSSTPRPLPKADPVPPYTPAVPVPRAVYPGPYSSHETSERSIKVDGSVKLDMNCVVEGSVKINGWRRNEVRVLVRDGSRFDYRVMEKSSKTDAPVWVKIVGAEPKQKYGPSSDCVSAGEVSIDVPLNASVTIRGREVSTAVDAVKKAEIVTIGGDISLRNITNGIIANAGQGDITVESSEGAMTLETTTGNILAFEAGPSDIGDVFTAKTTNGAVALQNFGFRQVNVNSITGSVAYTGAIKSGAAYNLRTTKGSIKLTLPSGSSFLLWATYGFGNFASELPMDLTTENVAPGSVKTITGKTGSGDGSLKLSTTNGSIGIRKL